nr:DUF881 domain-containing protein [Prescottella sp. R16]
MPEPRTPRTPRTGSRFGFGLLAVLLMAALGVGIATQVSSTGSGDNLDSARPADLLTVLGNLNQREAALRQEITGLEQTLSKLEAGGGSGAALDEAKARLSALSIQVGTVAATGPGVVLTVRDPGRAVGSDVLLDLMQELRAAGAEAIEIGGTGGDAAVRIGVDSWVTGTSGDITVDGRAVAAPYRIVAIGDPPTLAAALNIPGGVVDTVARSGGQLQIEQSAQVTVSALRDVAPRQYSRPAN